MGVLTGDLPLARRRARALVEEIRAEETERSRAHARTLRRIADLVEEMARPGGPAAPTGSAGAPTGPAAAGVVGVDPVGDPAAAAAAEIALALRLTRTAATRLVEQAQVLTTLAPTTMTALADGRIDPPRARLVTDALTPLPPEHARQLDAQLAPALGPLTTGQLAAHLRYLLARLAPTATRERARTGTRDRSVRLHPLPDGLAQLTATGPALDLAAVHDHLTTTATTRTGPHGRTDPHAATTAGLADPHLLTTARDTPHATGLPDRRGLDARRFDALVDLALTGTSTHRAPDTDRDAADRDAADGDHAGDGSGVGGDVSTTTARHPSTPARPGRGIQVVVALTSLLGLDDEPAHTPATGPVPVEHVRELLATGAPFRRALTHPLTGQLIALDGHLLTTDPPDTSSTPPPPDPGDGNSPGPHDGGPGPGGPGPGGSPDPGGTSGTSGGDFSTPATTPVPALPRRPRSACPVAAVGGGPYRPSAPTDRYVRTPTPTCTYPGCRIPATRCDLDHATPHAAGGPTCPCNLSPRCRTHHLAKHHHGWTDTPTTHDPTDTTVTWTSPLGQTTTVPGPPLLPRPPAPTQPRTDQHALDQPAPVDPVPVDPVPVDPVPAATDDTPGHDGTDATPTPGRSDDHALTGRGTSATSTARRLAAAWNVAAAGYRVVPATRTTTGARHHEHHADPREATASAQGTLITCGRRDDVHDLDGHVELHPRLLVGHPYPTGDLAHRDTRWTRDEHHRQHEHLTRPRTTTPTHPDGTDHGGWGEGPPPF